MLLLSTILPGHDLFHTLAGFETFLSAGWFCLVMKLLERILTGPVARKKMKLMSPSAVHNFEEFRFLQIIFRDG